MTSRRARTNEKRRSGTLPELLHTFCTLRLYTFEEGHLKRTMK